MSERVRQSTGRLLAAAAALALCAPVAHASAGSSQTAQPRPVVIAFVDEPGPVNVLHSDFASATGSSVDLPPGAPRVVRTSVPAAPNFSSAVRALAQGPLGHLRPGVPVNVTGTRLFVVAAPTVATPVQDVVTGDRLHATGVVDAAIGRRYGTAPDAIGVLVYGSAPDAYAWIAKQPWIDMVSTSGYELVPSIRSSSDQGTNVPVCESAAAVRKIIASGRLVFSSAGNTTDETEPLTSPNGLPEVYQVGGVDKQGRTWLPPRTEESDPFYTAGTTQRPYETGELFSFQAAGPDSTTGTVHFGGTSGATPRTAGRAAALIAYVRALPGWGSAPKAGAYASTRGHSPARGPLATGALTAEVLARVLRHSAVPAEAPTPARYFVEGYGALNDHASDVARHVLAGATPEPDRAQEDQARSVALAARTAAFSPPRC